MTSSRQLAIGAIFVGLMSVSWSAILVRLCVAEPIVIAAGRTIVATALLLPLFWPRRGELAGLDRGDWLAVLLAGLSLAAHFTAWNAAIQSTTLVNAVLLINVHPVFLLAIERWLGQRPSRRRLLGTALAMVGAMAIAFGSESRGAHGLTGDLYAVIGALTFATYLLLGRRVRSRLSLVGQVSLIYGTAAVALLITGGILGATLTRLTPATYGYLFLLGLVPTLAGHSSWNYATRHLAPSIVAVCALGEPLGAGFLAFLIFGESVGLAVLIAGAVLLAGLLLTILPEAPASKGSASSEEASVSSD